MLADNNRDCVDNLMEKEETLKSGHLGSMADSEDGLECSECAEFDAQPGLYSLEQHRVNGAHQGLR